MWHIFRLFVVCLFTLSLFCILKWNFNVMKISWQRHQLLIAWQADGDSCIGSPNFKCCNAATPARRRRRPRCEIAYVSYKTCKYLSGYAKKRKRKSQKRKQINWLRFALSKRDRGAKRLGNLAAAVAASTVVIAVAVVILCGWQITVAKTVENSIKLRANNRRRSILVDVVYIILLFAITEKQRQAQQCHSNNNSTNTRTHVYTHTHTLTQTYALCRLKWDVVFSLGRQKSFTRNLKQAV